VLLISLSEVFAGKEFPHAHGNQQPKSGNQAPGGLLPKVPPLSALSGQGSDRLHSLWTPTRLEPTST